MTESETVEGDVPTQKLKLSDKAVEALEEIDGSPPKVKAVKRFERMIDVQIETLNGIDDKAEYLTRFVGVLLGVVLTGLSLIPKFDGVSLTVESFPMLVSVFGSVLAFLCTLGFSIVTYLGSKFKYGVSPGVAEYFADTDVTEEEYAKLMLRGYADTIPKNEEVVRVNSRRFRNALASLLAGLGCLSLATFFLVVELPVFGKYAALIVAILVLGRILQYVLSEEYLTLDREMDNHE